MDRIEYYLLDKTWADSIGKSRFASKAALIYLGTRESRKPKHSILAWTIWLVICLGLLALSILLGLYLGHHLY